MPHPFERSTRRAGENSKITRASGAAFLIGAVLVVISPAAGQESALLWRDVAEAGALEPLRSPIAPLVLGVSVAAETGADRATQRGRLSYLQTMLAFSAVGQLAQFKASFGALPAAGVVAADLAGLEGYAAICAALRDAYFDRWRENNAADEPSWRDQLLIGARFFANAAVALLQQFHRDDGPGLADAEANLGGISASAGASALAVAAFQKAIGIYETARRGDAALSAADGAFATGLAGDGASVAQGARPPAQYYTASAVESLVPISVAIAGVGAARAALQAKDKAAAATAIDLVTRANAQADQVNQFLLSTWPCQPQLAELHDWRAQQDVVRRDYLVAFEPANGVDIAEATDAAAREFVAALAIALHASGPKDESFTVKRDQYLNFLRAAGKDADAAARVIAAVADSDVGGATPEPWRLIFDCGAAPN